MRRFVLAVAMLGTVLSAGVAEAQVQTKYYARVRLPIPIASGSGGGTDPSTPPVETADGSDAHGSCPAAMSFGENGGGSGAPIKFAYDDAEAVQICNDAAWTYGPGACDYAPSDGAVRFAIGGMHYPQQSQYRKGFQCAAAPKGTPRPPVPPAHHETSGAVCSVAPVDRMITTGGSNAAPPGDAASAEEALAYCRPLAAQFGEGVCSWKYPDNKAYYVIDGRAFEGYYGHAAANCR